MRRFAVIGAALIGEDGVRDVTTAVDIGSKSWPFDIRLRPWAFRPGIGLLPIGFCCATSPVVASAIRTRKWPLSRVFAGFNRQYVRSAHYGAVWDFFGPYALASEHRIGDDDANQRSQEPPRLDAQSEYAAHANRTVGPNARRRFHHCPGRRVFISLQLSRLCTMRSTRHARPV